jgi:tetratricopeptide (TPR) repeat protein
MMRRNGVRILLALLLSVAGQAAYPLPILKQQSEQAPALSPFDATMTRAHEALAAKKVDEARKLFQKAVQIDPKSMLPWLGLADVARLGNDQSGIELALKKAAGIAPDRPEPVVAMARLQYTRKNYDQAEMLLKKAAKLDGKSAIPLVDLGDMYLNTRQNPDKAIEAYREAIRIDPKHAGAHYALGSVLLSRGDGLGAIGALQTAQELVGSGNPLPSMTLGQAYIKVRKWKDAVEAFSRALTIQPGLPAAYIGRAIAQGYVGNRAAALIDLRKAEEIDPKNPEIPFRMGMILQEDGDLKAASDAYEKAIKVQPKFALAYNNLAWVATVRRERLNEAVQWIEKARSLVPKEATFFDTHGWVLRAKGDLNGSAKVLGEGIAISPSAELHYHLGVVEMERRRQDAARDNFRKALLIKPDFADAGDARSRLKELEAALAGAAK